jgi:predicted signal transduction protein with EAL and GGDEF domain
LAGAITSRETAARVGGDEFSVLVSDATPEARVGQLASDVARLLHEPFHVAGLDLRVGASVGIAIGHVGGDPEEVVRNADVALYASKASRTGTPHLYVPGMHDRLADRLRVSSALRGAVEKRQLALAYQPIVDLATGAIGGFEALARWHDPQLGDVPPGVFIPMAEQIGVMPELGDWVLRTAIREAATWRTRTPSLPRPYVAVNLSAVELQDGRLPERIGGLLQRYGMAATQLMLEMTESQLIDDLDVTVPVLGALRTQGIRIAIDDFGTGYSSLSYLRDLPADVVKIDRSFVARIGVDSVEWSFADAIVRLIHGLRLSVVAEGVETAEQLADVRAIGCEMAQGFYFGPARDAASARAALAEQDGRSHGSRSGRMRRMRAGPPIAAAATPALT